MPRPSLLPLLTNDLEDNYVRRCIAPSLLRGYRAGVSRLPVLLSIL
jgi:hypothetical protein